MTDCSCFNHILGIVGSVFDVYSAVLFTERGAGVYEIAAYFSLGDKIDPGSLITEGKGLVGWVLREQKPLLAKSFDQKSNFLGYYRRGGEDDVKTFLACPIGTKEGVLCIDSKKTYSFSSKDQKILAQFAQLVSLLSGDYCRISHSRQEFGFYSAHLKLRELRERYPRWSNFLQKYLQILAQSTGFEFCFLAVRDERGKSFMVEGANSPFPEGTGLKMQKFRMGSGLIGWIFNNYQKIYTELRDAEGSSIPLFAKDTAQLEFKTAICLPLLVHKKTRGVLVLADRKSIPINSALKNFAVSSADYLALLLDNLYLKNKLQAKPKPTS